MYRWCSDRGGSVLGSVGLKALGLAGSATPRHSRVPVPGGRFRAHRGAVESVQLQRQVQLC